MKRAILMTMTLVLVAAATVSARAAEPPTTAQVTVLLAGDSEANSISIWLSPDGLNYVIDSAAALEVGGDVCTHPEGQPNELICAAASIAGFEVNAGAGEDAVIVSRAIPVPVTLRGGPGHDRLVGGADSDKLLGGPGDDMLVGRAGKDSLLGGPGEDRLVGGPDYDVLRGGSGEDLLRPGSGDNYVIQ
ncbi:MAG TPA: hypothetical protein VFI03_13700 [Solirubrobacterales bacterium]|nr:hypothetical protein [Solirubrobacterales bacterium]